MLRRFLLGFILGSGSVGAGAQPADIAADPLPGLVLQRLRAAVAPSCIAVAVVDERVRVSFACSEKAAPTMLARDSLFEIGSIGKGLTAILLADMALKGELSLDDPVARHARRGAPLPARKGREMTLRDLATHTSGLPRLPPKFAPRDDADPYADFTVDMLYAALADTRLSANAGEDFEYSNFGYMWLSEMLARRGGKPFDVLLRERVLVPLGMKDTVLNGSLSDEQRKRRIAGHDAEYRVVPEWRMHRDLSGPGGFSASLDDMIALAEALLGRRETPLKDAIALALEPQRKGDWFNSVGLGWMTWNTSGMHWHDGGTGGFSSMIAVSRRSGRAAIVLVDSEQSFDDLARHLVEPREHRLRKRFFGRFLF